MRNPVVGARRDKQAHLVPREAARLGRFVRLQSGRHDEIERDNQLVVMINRVVRGLRHGEHRGFLSEGEAGGTYHTAVTGCGASSAPTE